jgi:hypothetical protein
MHDLDEEREQPQRILERSFLGRGRGELSTSRMIKNFQEERHLDRREEAVTRASACIFAKSRACFCGIPLSF